MVLYIIQSNRIIKLIILKIEENVNLFLFYNNLKGLFDRNFLLLATVFFPFSSQYDPQSVFLTIRLMHFSGGRPLLLFSSNGTFYYSVKYTITEKYASKLVLLVFEFFKVLLVFQLFEKLPC